MIENRNISSDGYRGYARSDGASRMSENARTDGSSYMNGHIRTNGQDSTVMSSLPMYTGTK